MAYLIKDQAIHRSYSIPLFIREAKDDRTQYENAVAPPTVSDNLDSTCITPILNACSSTASQRSSLSITPSKSYTTTATTTTYLTPRSSLSSDTLGDSIATEFFSFASELEEPNETITNQSGTSIYETCVDASVRLLNATRSVRRRLRLGQASTQLLNRLSKLQGLSIVRASQINIRGDTNKKSDYCNCKDGIFDGNCLKTFMEMSVQPAEYRTNSQIMTSTPIITKEVYDHGIFNVARIKKVELHDLSPKVPEFNVIDTMSKDRCINNNNVLTPNGNHYNSYQPNIVIPNTQPHNKGQHQSNAVTMPAPEDGNVLKKVISFTLDQMTYTDCVTEKATRLSFVPEKLHFSAYEQFKGQLFVKWVCTSIGKSLELYDLDLNMLERLISEVCTHLIAAGVMKQITDCDEKTKDVFCPNEIYQWTHMELSRQQFNEEKKGHLHSVQTKHDHNGTITPDSNGHEETFSSIKSKLFLHELNGEKLFINSENYSQQNQNRSDINMEMENIQEEINVRDHQLENGQKDNQNCVDCDNSLRKVFVEKTTQTEDIVEVAIQEKRPCEYSSVIPTPPPPPPLPLFITKLNETTNEKLTAPECSSAITVTPHISNQSVTQNAQPATILSSASSFCAPPPPPMNGIPGPPPLPLPTGNIWFKSDTLRKAAKHPPKPMINLFWTRILIPMEDDTEQIKKDDSDVNVCTLKKREKLWQKIDETILENAEDFTELFARQATPKRPREIAKVTKKTVIKVLDHKRSQSVGIFSQSLYRHRIDPKVIQRAIYNWDTSNIGLDLLQQMLEHRASCDEIKAIKEAQKNVTLNVPLDGPESFLLNFSEISCAPERIACIIFQNDFEESNALIDNKIKIIKNLCDFLMENSHLNDLFAIILTLGNFMNGGNRYRGQADGFGLDVLNKLKDVKSKDKKLTLLHFIVKTFIGKRRQSGLKPKEIIFPLPDADDIKSASTVDFDALKEQIDQLNRNLSDIEAKMRIVIDLSTEQNLQPFKDISAEFVQNATKKISYQFQQLETCKGIFRETLDYFKHIPKTGSIDECTPSQFFELWSNFCIDFRDLWRKELAAINAEIIQKYKSIASPKTPQNRTKGKPKPSGLRVRRVNQI